MEEKIIQLTEFVKERFQGESTGHDWYHIKRVVELSKYIQQKEGGDTQCVQVAALLHDISDHKFNGGDFNKGASETREILQALNFETEFIDRVCIIVKAVSYKGAGVKDEMTSLEGKIVQDADRLDAIGAIGIARTFAYGGAIKQPIYEPEEEPEFHVTKESYIKNRTHTINHFYEKLLLLRDRMHTTTAKSIATERHELMLSFLDEFYKEWNVEL